MSLEKRVDELEHENRALLTAAEVALVTFAPHPDFFALALVLAPLVSHPEHTPTPHFPLFGDATMTRLCLEKNVSRSSCARAQYQAI